MRLINVETLVLEEFMGSCSADQEYAILSHTWEDGEVMFQDFTSPDMRRTEMKGFAKIKKACELAKKDGTRFAWVDTCCIDKTSSAELTEAINSMFSWYRNAKACYVWLADLPVADDGLIESLFKKCRWFTRGWTLQELIAPRNVEFYDREWNFRGTKKELRDLIADASKIRAEVLEKPERLYDLSIAQRMSWAATRETTRIEDIAYCLLGIFGVNMPMLYGEGQRAFTRLQEEIAKETNDLSIFAWKMINKDQKFHGVLATSPADFRECGAIRLIDDPMFIPEWSIGNKGLRIQTDLIAGKNGTYLFRLNCKDESKPSPISIWLKDHGRGMYSRERASEYGDLAPANDPRPVESNKSIYIAKQLSASRSRELEGSHRGAIFLRHNVNSANEYLFNTYLFNTWAEIPFPDFPFSACAVLPECSWNSQRRMVHTQGVAEFNGLVYFGPRREKITQYKKNSLLNALRGEWFIVAFGCTPGTKPWVTLHGKTDEQGLNLLQVGMKDIQRMGALAREKVGQPLRTTIYQCDGVPWKDVVVSLNSGKLDGELVYYIDLNVEEAEGLLPA